LFRYVGTQTSTCLPLGADAPPVPPLAAALPPVPALPPPELEPAAPLVEPATPLPEPAAPPLEPPAELPPKLPVNAPLEPLDPLDPLLEPELPPLEPPPDEAPFSSDGMFCAPLLLQPAASAHANQSDWATAERRTAATTDGRALRLLMVGSRDAECVPMSSRSPILQTAIGVSLSSARWRGRVRRRIAPPLRRLSRESAQQLRTMRERSRLPRGRLQMADTNAGCAAFVAWVHTSVGASCSPTRCAGSRRHGGDDSRARSISLARGESAR
jgi:hypothetical protein